MDLSFDNLSSSIMRKRESIVLLGTPAADFTHMVLEDILQPESVLIRYVGCIQTVPFECLIGRRVDCELLIRVE